MSEIIYAFLHMDQTLAYFLENYHSWVYVLLFSIIFCETGLIFMPFLPGDSLLFAAGGLAAISQDKLKIEILIPIIMIASFVGDNVNYFVGRKHGRRLFELKHPLSFLFSVHNLNKTEAFYQKKGHWAVSMARFFPIIRTFAPFVAGVAQMNYREFMKYSIIGTIGWVMLFCLTGYYFGQIPFIKQNFTVLVMSIIGISLAPLIISFFKQKLLKSL